MNYKLINNTQKTPLETIMIASKLTKEEILNIKNNM